MELGSIVKRLQSFAMPQLAESWDNTGLLVEPSGPHIVKTLLLTNDLTESVMDEAVDLKSDMVLSYHPPIFQPLKRLVQHSWKERIIVKCIENRIAVFSPHTTYDNVEGGVNDWLISPFGIMFIIFFVGLQVYE
jgi:putative NIF3 family GTP cyclohydrolase 1 type 2